MCCHCRSNCKLCFDWSNSSLRHERAADLGVAKTEPEEKQSNTGSQKENSVYISCFKSHIMDDIAHNGLNSELSMHNEQS